MTERVADRRGFVGRRGFLTGALAAGSLVGLAACGGDGGGTGSPPVSPSGMIAPPTPAAPPIATASGAAASPTAAGLPPIRLFTDEAMNFDALFGLGEASYGVSEAGEVLTAVNQANAAGATYDAYVAAFRAMADRLAAASDAAAARGDAITSRDTALRAATYYTRALFFVLGSAHPEQEPGLYRAYRAAWDRGIGGTSVGSPVGAVALRVPYGDGTLPAWLLRPDESGVARRTVIVNNGSDAQGVELLAYGVRAALDRGWNAVVFDGPGQGEMLFLRGTSFRPDWEQVITPIVDVLTDRPDVDSDRIALTGWSMGGELVVRAAAREPRLAALVSDPGTVDVWAAFPPSLRSIVVPGDPGRTNAAWNSEVVPNLTPEQRFTLAKRLEIFTPAALAAARRGALTTDFAVAAAKIERFSARDVAARIRCPILALDYEDENFYPGQPEELMGLATTDRKDYVKLTAADGAQMHCAPMAPARRNEVVFDWLDDVVPA